MIRSLAWVGRKQFYKGRYKFPQINISWRKAYCDLALLASGESQQPLSFACLIGKPTLSRVIRETYDAIFEALAGEYLSLLHQQKNGKILLVTSKRHGIYPMLSAELMANILEFNVQNRAEPFFIIVKDSSALYCWQLMMLDTASHYLMLVSMEAITMLEC